MAIFRSPRARNCAAVHISHGTRLWTSCTRLKIRQIELCKKRLTLFQIAVKHSRSLTVSNVFPIGGKSGAQASSHRPPADLEVISTPATAVVGDGGAAVPHLILLRHGGAAVGTSLRPQRRRARGAQLPGRLRVERPRRPRIGVAPMRLGSRFAPVSPKRSVSRELAGPLMTTFAGES